MNLAWLIKFFWITMLLLPLATLAADSSDCSFLPPTGLLQAKAYRAYGFQPGSNNEATESADIAKDVHLDIQHSRCADFIVTKFNFRVTRISIVAGSANTSLGFAIRELANLKLIDTTRATSDLLAFLKIVHAKNASGRIFSACKDGSTAPPGECSWDSLGGYIFEVKPQKDSTTISATEYTSG